jgi:tellurite resistance protein TehA-like permease
VKVENLSRGEWIAMLGGLILGISVFLPVYGADQSNPNATLHTGARGVCGDGTCSFFQVHTITRWLIIAAAVAPFILAWIIVREHELSWPRGQVTSIVAITALGLVGYLGIIERPGEPSGDIGLEFGWFFLLLGGILMLVGSVMRQAETEVKRKPPGTL